MKKIHIPSTDISEGNKSVLQVEEHWVCDDACVLDIDNFLEILARIKAKGVSPKIIGSIITEHASKWLPTLTHTGDSTKSVITLWTKKKSFIETLLGVLPPERDAIHCDFLLRLLRVANMVGVDVMYRARLEKRISWQLDQASLNELMIPSFSHTCCTLLDVELVIRLVKRFVKLDEKGAGNGDAMVIKVAKLVDCYLFEAALDSNLSLRNFVSLACSLPDRARDYHDGLYRAIDVYIRTHTQVSKPEKKALYKIIDIKKLSREASADAIQNEHLPVRVLVQVIFFDQTKLNGQLVRVHDTGLESCDSNNETRAQQMKIEKLREDVDRLKRQCCTMQQEMEKLLLKKKKKRFKLKMEGWVVSFKKKMKTNLIRGKIESKWTKSMSNKTYEYVI